MEELGVEEESLVFTVAWVKREECDLKMSCNWDSPLFPQKLSLVLNSVETFKVSFFIYFDLSF